MAVKITSSSSIQRIMPDKNQFDINDFDEYVKGWTEPFKVGDAWVVYSEKNKKTGVNEIATLMFGIPIWGDVLVVPPQQMPDEWDIEEDVNFTVDDFDTNFLNTIEKTLDFVRQFEDIREEWLYKPGAIDINEDVTLLFLSAYDYLISTDFNDLEKDILYQDELIILKSNGINDSIHFLNQLLEYFVELEQYEKCAIIKKIIDKYNN